jgi:hypothetical protein
MKSLKITKKSYAILSKLRMRKMRGRNEILKKKILRLVFLFIFISSLTAGGVSADTMCMAECCLPTVSVGLHHAMGGQMKSFSGCHSNFKILSTPCDVQSQKNPKVPECTLTTSRTQSPNTIGSIEMLSHFNFDNIAVQSNYWVQTVTKKIHSSPIYLQIQSLLI